MAEELSTDIERSPRNWKQKINEASHSVSKVTGWRIGPMVAVLALGVVCGVAGTVLSMAYQGSNHHQFSMLEASGYPAYDDYGASPMMYGQSPYEDQYGLQGYDPYGGAGAGYNDQQQYYGDGYDLGYDPYGYDQYGYGDLQGYDPYGYDQYGDADLEGYDPYGYYDNGLEGYDPYGYEAQDLAYDPYGSYDQYYEGQQDDGFGVPEEQQYYDEQYLYDDGFGNNNENFQREAAQDNQHNNEMQMNEQQFLRSQSQQRQATQKDNGLDEYYRNILEGENEGYNFEQQQQQFQPVDERRQQRLQRDQFEHRGGPYGV